MKKTKPQKSVLRRILRYVGRYPLSLVASLFFAIVTVAATLCVVTLASDQRDFGWRITQLLSVDHSAVDLDLRPRPSSRTNHSPQSQPTTRSVSSGPRSSSPFTSLPNATCTALVGDGSKATVRRM